MSPPEPPPDPPKEPPKAPLETISLAEMSQRLEGMQARIDELEKARPQNPAPEEKKAKDGWDKVDIIFKFLGSVLIAGIGLYFTHEFNNRQMQANLQQKERDDAYRDNQAQLNKIQAIGQLTPMLTGNNRRQVDVGILLVNELTNDTNLLRHLARELKDQGGAKAIITLSNSEQNQDKKEVYKSILQELYVYEADPGDIIEVAIEPRIPDKTLTVEFAGRRLRHKGGAFTIKLGRKPNRTYYLKVNFPLPAGTPPQYSITFHSSQANIKKRDFLETNGKRALYTGMFVVD